MQEVRDKRRPSLFDERKVRDGHMRELISDSQSEFLKEKNLISITGFGNRIVDYDAKCAHNAK